MNIALHDIVKTYRTGAATRTVLPGISLELSSERCVGIIGPNGCGKTTLVSIVAGLLSPDKGEIIFDPPLNGRSDIGFGWQDYRAALLPWDSAVENVAFPLRIRGMGRLARRQRAIELMKGCLPEVDPDQPCFELSGGQKQVVSVLRSIAAGVKVLILDEPFSAVDQQRRWQLIEALQRMWVDQRWLLVFVSHDVDEAILFGHDLILMERWGRIHGTIRNPLPMPRAIESLTSPEHVSCRDRIVSFLVQEARGSSCAQQA